MRIKRVLGSLSLGVLYDYLFLFLLDLILIVASFLPNAINNERAATKCKQYRKEYH